MTSRNLNKTWRDVIFEQYAADLEADSPFPYSYLIHIPEWKKDFFFDIPEKIEIQVFKKAVHKFHVSIREAKDLNFEGEHISVRPRKTWRERQEEGTAETQEGDVPTSSA
ncbi:hypothetical protein NW762_007590 [Fusarium torreyae]|uniref:Uncharacterized protein n=1 Tax=Fusarium torreyae TaxID=1237075 RepID=A0A9W8RYU0_9HYPO|nr:hypothetical protein NW762_007590 [Fusarium torreyae]